MRGTALSLAVSHHSGNWKTAGNFPPRFLFSSVRLLTDIYIDTAPTSSPPLSLSLSLSLVVLFSPPPHHRRADWWWGWPQSSARKTELISEFSHKFSRPGVGSFLHFHRNDGGGGGRKKRGWPGRRLEREREREREREGLADIPPIPIPIAPPPPHPSSRDKRF